MNQADHRSERIIAGTLLRLQEEDSAHNLRSRAGRRWPEIYWRLRDLLTAFRHPGDMTDRDQLAWQIMRLLSATIPAGLEDWLTHGLAPATGTPYPYLGPNGSALQEVLATRLDRFLTPAEQRFEVELTYPKHLRSGEQAEVTLGILPLDWPLPKEALESASFQVRASGLGLKVLSAEDLSLEVTRQSPSPALTFGVEATEAGVSSLVVDIWRGKELIRALPVTIKVTTSGVSAGQPGRLRADLVAGGGRPPGADVRIRVISAGDRLFIEMKFPNPQRLKVTGELKLHDPEGYWRELRAEIEEHLKQGTAAAALPTLGMRLYDDFWPAELRPALWSIIDQGLTTVFVLTDDPWIPWELMLPYRVGGTEKQVRSDFLCQQFDLARWIFMDDGTVPRDSFGLGHLGVVTPTFHDLPAVGQEAQMLRGLVRSRGLEISAVDPADRATTLEAIADTSPAIDLWHLAGHGDHPFTRPDEAPLWLEDETCVYPKDMTGPGIVGTLRKTQPAVFLNACRVAHGGKALTGMGGWASRLTGRCGVGALMAPLWAVSDEPAYAFAKAFYELVPEHSDGSIMTFARAMRLTRGLIRNRFPEDPTWLAYALFAHPNARIATRSAGF